MLSLQSNESNSIDANNDWGLQRINGNIIFILVYTFSRHFYETSFVLKYSQFYENIFEVECDHLGWISQLHTCVVPSCKLWSNL